MIKVDTRYLNDFVKEHEFEYMADTAHVMSNLVKNGLGAGNDYLGWVDLPTNYDVNEFNRIVTASDKIRANSDVLVVIGIGGSYLGARAIIELLNSTFYNEVNSTKIVFAGQNMDDNYLNDLINYLSDKDFSINVISKSGTTTEPAIAFRVLSKLLEDKYQEEAKSRIYVTTDSNKGALRNQVNLMGYESFNIPGNIGGRFSVLTAVGLLPIAVSGVNIKELMDGAKLAQDKLFSGDDSAVKYAIARNVLYNKGKNIELVVSYNPKFVQFNEWLKQLFCESEGKDQKGVLITSAIYSTDLHSLGQYVQDGRRDLFETVLRVKHNSHNIVINKQANDGDGLNYLAGKSLTHINDTALEATVLAHVSGGVPNIIIDIEELNTMNVGYMIYFFELACAISGYLLAVNPFDQPGVESYKNNMFALLDKPGYEEIKGKLLGDNYEKDI